MDAGSAPERVGEAHLSDQCRISGVTLGLPARRRDFQRQKERKPALCQRITVSGSTIVSASRIRGAIRYRQTKMRRSKLRRAERLGALRDRQHSFAAGSRRIAPSLRPDLICRQGQPLQPRLEGCRRGPPSANAAPSAVHPRAAEDLRGPPSVCCLSFRSNPKGWFLVSSTGAADPFPWRCVQTIREER